MTISQGFSCSVLNCSIGELLEYIPEDPKL